MLKLLIAEDEPKIAAGLQKQIESMNLDLEVIGIAQDGEAALEAARRLLPDILLVDICMPFLNGLELLERLQECAKKFKVIIISGYSEFEYAKRSVELAVYAYILKPVDIKELKKKLEEIILEIQHDKHENEYLQFAVEQLNRRKDMLIRTFLHDAINGGYSPEEIREHCSFFSINANLKYNLLLIKVPAEVYEIHSINEILLPLQIEGVLKNLLSEYNHAYLFSDDRGNMLLLYRQNAGIDKRFYDEIKTDIKRELGIQVNMENMELTDLDNIADSYDKLIGLLFDDKQFSPLVAKALNYIAKGYTRHNFGLEETAAAVGITPAYLSRLLKNEVGTSFSRYVAGLRIEYAVELMNKGLLIKDVADRAGFSSPFYFSTAFKKILNMPPNEYRIKGKKQDET